MAAHFSASYLLEYDDLPKAHTQTTIKSDQVNAGYKLGQMPRKMQREQIA
jgi:hypothetical protein